MRFPFLSCFAALLVSTAQPVSAKVYALVIGIDDYQHIEKLDGAVNDALDVADALRSAADAEVHVLLDDKADRTAIISKWRELAGKIGPDDRLIVSYAGHGSNEPEHFSGSELDGRDETLLLAGFAPRGAAAGERIRDNELAELLELTPPGSTLFLADACHSGTLTRSVVPTLGWRFISNPDLTDDPLPPPPPTDAKVVETDNAMLFLAAADDASKVPELLIEGQARGALSYAFAQGIRGAADFDGDGSITTGEVAEHVRKVVRTLSNGLQVPQVASGTAQDTAILSLRSSESQPLSGPVFETAFNDLPTLSMSTKSPFADATRLDGVDYIADHARAHVTLDPKTGVLRTSVGDVVKRFSEPVALQPLQSTMDTLRAVEALKSQSTGTLEITFGGGDRLYGEGDNILVNIEGRTQEHLVLFNIASDGTANFLYPLQKYGDPTTIDPSSRVGMSLEVIPPFGTEYIIALETTESVPGLLSALRALDGVSDVPTLWTELGFAVQGLAEEPKVTVFPFHTSGDIEG
ncbi:MAG: caspase family protein [Pseudomonadota bacterium]